MTTIVTKLIPQHPKGFHPPLVHATVWKGPEFVVQNFNPTISVEEQHFHAVQRVARMARLFGEWEGETTRKGYRFMLKRPGGTRIILTFEGESHCY